MDCVRVSKEILSIASILIECSSANTLFSVWMEKKEEMKRSESLAWEKRWECLTRVTNYNEKREESEKSVESSKHSMGNIQSSSHSSLLFALSVTVATSIYCHLPYAEDSERLLHPWEWTKSTRVGGSSYLVLTVPWMEVSWERCPFHWLFTKEFEWTQRHRAIHKRKLFSLPISLTGNSHEELTTFQNSTFFSLLITSLTVYCI